MKPWDVWMDEQLNNAFSDLYEEMKGESMERFSLYDYILNEGYKLSKEDLQRIGAELVFAIYSNVSKEQYRAIINEAIDTLNEYNDLQLPHEEA
jgi:hypothetical protein